MNRKLMLAFFAIGLALVVAPFALSLPSKTAAGERMLNGFRPVMQADQVAITAQYYNDVFVPLGRMTPLLGQLPPSMQKGFGSMLQTAHVDPTVFGRVPAGLAHYKPLVTTMQANVDNYAQVDSLPSFRLFTWFFVVPGALLMLLAGIGMWQPIAGAKHTHHARPTTA